MADRNTKIRASQLLDGNLSKADIGATGEVTGHILTVQTDKSVSWDANISSINYIFNNSGNILTAGLRDEIRVDFKCEILEVSLIGDPSGSIEIDILKSDYINLPPVASITASEIPSISFGIKYNSSSLVGWTTTINAGDFLSFYINSASVMTRCTISLKVRKIL